MEHKIQTLLDLGFTEYNTYNLWYKLAGHTNSDGVWIKHHRTKYTLNGKEYRCVKYGECEDSGMNWVCPNSIYEKLRPKISPYIHDSTMTYDNQHIWTVSRWYSLLDQIL
jgi:hypothetical protein